jgi:hypothetical protein
MGRQVNPIIAEATFMRHLAILAVTPNGDAGLSIEFPWLFSLTDGIAEYASETDGVALIEAEFDFEVRTRSGRLAVGGAVLRVSSG